VVSSLGLALSEFLEQRSQAAGHAADGAGRNGSGRLPGRVAVCVHHEPDGGGEGRAVDVVGETADA
jgi:hypothetical protein